MNCLSIFCQFQKISVSFVKLLTSLVYYRFKFPSVLFSILVYHCTAFRKFQSVLLNFYQIFGLFSIAFSKFKCCQHDLVNFLLFQSVLLIASIFWPIVDSFNKFKSSLLNCQQILAYFLLLSVQIAVSIFGLFSAVSVNFCQFLNCYYFSVLSIVFSKCWSVL